MQLYEALRILHVLELSPHSVHDVLHELACLLEVVGNSSVETTANSHQALSVEHVIWVNDRH